MSFADPFTLAIVAIVLLSILGLPIGHAMIGGSIFYLFLAGLDMGTAAEQLLNGLYTSYILIAVPLFILAAEIMNSGTITTRLLEFCNALVGRFRGGLALVNVAQSVIFAGMSGSAIADAAGTGKMMQTMMTAENRYPPSFAAALTASTAVIGPIIPPSIPVVLYALVSDASIGYLFLAGVVPGLVMGLAQATLIIATARRRRFPVEPPVPLRRIPAVTLRALPALLMPVVLLGGIYGGATTPTEAAAVAALYALLVSALLYRSVGFASLYASLASSARTTASIGMLIAGALVFNYVVTVENIPRALQTFLAGYELSPLAFLLAVNAVLLVLGCLLEGTTILLIVVPILVPTAEALGIDLVHFGIIVVVNIMIGLITPPYGLLLFIMTSIAGVPLRALVGEVLPFLGAMLVALAIFTLFPDLVLWLPRVFGYQNGLTETMTKPIHVLNGPNLNRLGMREPEVYGRTTLAEIEAMCREAAGDHPLVFRQSNAEHQIVDWIHEAIDESAGIIINPAGLSFRSVPILDALKMFPGPVFELHITNIHRRDEIYRHSLVSKAATAVIAGLGADGYPTAVAALLRYLSAAATVPVSSATV